MSGGLDRIVHALIPNTPPPYKEKPDDTLAGGLLIIETS
jgi:hypothetical protein